MARVLLSLATAVAACCANANPGRSTLFRAIAAVESIDGATSANVYQLQPSYVADVNRIQRKLQRVDGRRRETFSCLDVMSRSASERMMEIYWDYYGKRIQGPVTDEIRAKLHRVGFRGLRTRRATAEAYWRRVRKAMAR